MEYSEELTKKEKAEYLLPFLIAFKNKNYSFCIINGSWCTYCEEPCTGEDLEIKTEKRIKELEAILAIKPTIIKEI